MDRCYATASGTAIVPVTVPFLSIHAATYNTFYHQRHLLNRPTFKELRAASFEVWSAATACA